MKLLFIGNSATYVHEIPQMLQRLAGEKGYAIEMAQITPGGYELSRHADDETAHGVRVLEEIRRGYDIVFLQENGNCISSAEKRAASVEAAGKLIHAIRESGATPYFYVRPPYGKTNAGRDPYLQCAAFDKLFSEIAAKNGGVPCVYANRAYALAMRRLSCELWGADHAHTSVSGAYLIAAVFFATLFGASATQLSTDIAGVQDPRALQEIADEIALFGVCPFEA